MTQEYAAVLIDEATLSIDEIAVSCSISRDWVVEHVQAGALSVDPNAQVADWAFSGRDLQRARRLIELERDFDANPELAGLVADLFDELERLRKRLRRAGLSTD